LMPHIVYIIHSETLDKYYVGHTDDIDQRIRKHLTNHSGFTAKTKDWLVVHVVECASKTEAIQLEMRIKKRGAARYLDDLTKSS
jgi:putative endonuclease